MARLNNAPSANSGGPVAAGRGHASRPSVTKEDIQKVEKEIVEAEKMVEVAVESRNAKVLQREQEALKKIRESEEFQAKVESFRWKLMSPPVLSEHFHFTDTS
jgi:rRNA maturation endonuclease Nob1